jgi:hypothetical protein
MLNVFQFFKKRWVEATERIRVQANAKDEDMMRAQPMLEPSLR